MFDWLPPRPAGELFGAATRDIVPSRPRPPRPLGDPADLGPAPPGTPLLPLEDLTDEGAILGPIAAAEELAAAPPPESERLDAALAQLGRCESWLLDRRAAAPGGDDPRLAAMHARLRRAREALLRARDDRRERELATLRDGRPEGRLFVAGSTAEDALASDRDSFSTALAEALRGRPQGVVDVIAKVAATWTGGRDAPQLATVADSAADRPGSGHIARKQVAVYVANQHYAIARPLQTPISDAQAMRGRMAARGYEGEVREDQTEAGMAAAFDGAAADPALGPGDAVFLYYAGHGSKQGLMGVDYSPEPDEGLYPYERLSQAARAATQRGVDATVVMDSCHSGQGVAEMRRGELGALEQATRGGGHQPLAELAREIDGAKRRFAGSCLKLSRAAARDVVPADDSFAARGYDLLRGDLVAELRGLAARFETLAGRPLASARRLAELQRSDAPPSSDIIDDMTNEVMALVQGRRAIDGR